jgi:hypothetical protein
MKSKTHTIILSILLVFGVQSVFGQKLLLFEDVKQSLREQKRNYGPNKRHYIHTIGAIGQLTGTANDSLPINYANSQSWGIGVRYKLKLTSWFANGLDCKYNYQQVGIKQQEQKTFPTPVLYDEEKFGQHQFGLSYFWRFQPTRTGNTVGKLLDIGVYGNWTFVNTHVMENEKNIPNASTMKIKYRNVDYMEPFEYGAIGRIGFSSLALFAKYRLSNVFKSSNSKYTPTVPNVWIGIDIKLGH